MPTLTPYGIWLEKSFKRNCHQLLNAEAICSRSFMESNKEINEKVSNEEEDETFDTSPAKKSKKKSCKKDKEAMKVIKPKPNFFLGFQIHDAVIHQKVKKLQEEIITKNPKLFPALIDISTLHVTLAVTQLVGEKDVKRIKENLDKWATKNLNTYFKEPLTLSFTGVNTFKNVVAYVDIEPCTNKERLIDLMKSLNDMLSSGGYVIDPKGLTPHLTVLKLSKNYKLLKSRKHFHEDFDNLKNNEEHFGKQEVKTLQLLSMDEPKDEKGYYKCLHEIYVSAPKTESDSTD